MEVQPVWCLECIYKVIKMISSYTTISFCHWLIEKLPDIS